MAKAPPALRPHCGSGSLMLWNSPGGWTHGSFSVCGALAHFSSGYFVAGTLLWVCGSVKSEPRLPSFPVINLSAIMTFANLNTRELESTRTSEASEAHACIILCLFACNLLSHTVIVPVSLIVVSVSYNTSVRITGLTLDYVWKKRTLRRCKIK